MSTSSWITGPPPRTAPRPVPASFGTRALAFGLDWLIGLSLVVGITWVLQGTLDYDLHSMAEAAGDLGWDRVDRTGLEQALGIAGGVILVGTMLADAVGGSVGKRLMGIRVADESTGGHLGLPRATLRMLARVLSIALCWSGYVLALFDDRTRTWHDRIAGSVVVTT